MRTMTDELLKAADAYILALRQIVYARHPGVVDAAWQRVDDLGAKWNVLRSQVEEESRGERG